MFSNLLLTVYIYIYIYIYIYYIYVCIFNNICICMYIQQSNCQVIKKSLFSLVNSRLSGSGPHISLQPHISCSSEAKHSNRSCYANLQLSIETIVNLCSTTCCCAWLRHSDSERQFSVCPQFEI